MSTDRREGHGAMSRLIAIGLGALCAAAGCQRHSPAPAAGGSWTTFHDSALGYSFRYPSDLRVTRPPLATFGIAGLVGAVELTAPGPERLVLRVLVVDVPDNTRTATDDPASLRRACRTYEEFRIAGRIAVNCVSCGRASCAWTVHVPGARAFRMLSGMADERTQPRPRDGQFPLRSIITSFRWHERD